MAIGPVQLIVLGFERPDFHGEIIAELERLRESDTVRVIDALAVYKDAAGDVGVEHLSNLSEEEAIEPGQQGRRAGGTRHRGRGRPRSRRRRGCRGGRRRRPGVLRRGRLGRDRGDPERLGRRAGPDRAPLGGAAARRRHARRRFRIADGFISPLDLVAIGLATAEEAEALHAQETAGATGTN